MKRALVGVSLLAMPLALFGQSAPANLTFEVASIKPSDPKSQGNNGIQFMPGGGLRMTNMTLKWMVIFAYDVHDFQVTGGPAWIDSQRYDLVAKPDTSTDADNLTKADGTGLTPERFSTAQQRIQARLRPLLAERFQLMIHRETREQAVYAMVVAKGGPKLEESKGDRPIDTTQANLTAARAPLPILAQMLSDRLGRPVLDQTGLKGEYDFELSWTPGPGEIAGEVPLGGSMGPPAPNAPPPPDPNGPSLFTAIQEQLGLRLESTKGPVEMIVIDRAEKASEN